MSLRKEEELLFGSSLEDKLSELNKGKNLSSKMIDGKPTLFHSRC